MSDLLGRSFAGYEIDAVLGAGGMATVYRAHKRGVAGATKQVALKVIHPHLVASQNFLRMFKDEMRVATALSHRNIVQTFDVGQSGDHYYIAMELVTGCTLSRLITECGAVPLPLDVALFIAMEVCSGLEHAHTLAPRRAHQPTAVVHRDISPSNILTSTDGDVKVVDFGIAKASGRLGLSRAGEVKGKAGYVAPEQIFGQTTARSDLFSLGAVLYELLGGGPLRGDIEWNAVLAAANSQTLPPTRPLKDLPETTPPGLIALVGRCIANNPSQRPESARTLRDALSEELFAIQRRLGQRDLHHALGELVREATATPPAQQPSAQADRLAAALLAEADRLSEDEGPPTSQSTRATELDRPAPKQPVSKRGPWLAALIAVATLILTAVFFWTITTHQAESPERKITTQTHEDAGAAPAPAPDVAPAPASAPTSKPATRRVIKRPRKARVGMVDINALPWAKVYINGRYRGNTPLQRLKVRAGQHRLRLVNPDQKLSLKTHLRVVAGQRAKRFYRLQRR